MVDYLKSKIFDTNWVTKALFTRVQKVVIFMLIPTILIFHHPLESITERAVKKTKLNFCKDENEVDFYKYGYQFIIRNGI